MATKQLRPRRVPLDDVEAFVRAGDSVFGLIPDDADVAFYSSLFDPDYALAIYDGGRIVATASANSFELTLPAGPDHPLPTVTAPGVTAVGVQPTHRRRGLLTALMHRQIRDYRDRGFRLSMLTASEGAIYGRFGYGLATSYRSVAVNTKHAAFREDAPITGRMRLLDPDDARKVLPELHDQARRLRPGDITRLGPWWDRYFDDPDKDRDGGGGQFHAVHESSRGEPDGWVSYRYHYSWGNGVPAHRVDLRGLVALHPAARASLWRYLLDLDLVGEVTAEAVPMDEPLRWLLTDPRQVRVGYVGDHLWVRLIDVPGSLTARGYRTEARLVLDVRDEGRFLLETAPTGAWCRPARKGEKTDLILGLAELGAIYLGGVRPSVLAAAGRVNEERVGALGRADAAFGSPIAPYCGTDF
ncbi:MAG TPA: GNAT family N-acetyltransferase [Acidimicrobiales bacterium]|nr:GNAT family N-acetyltransferase [Acidimicrobiales bacterium]